MPYVQPRLTAHVNVRVFSRGHIAIFHCPSLLSTVSPWYAQCVSVLHPDGDEALTSNGDGMEKVPARSGFNPVRGEVAVSF